MKMTKQTSSMKRGVLLILLIFVDMPQETKQEDVVVRTFDKVHDVGIEGNMHMLTRQQTVSTKMRCTSLCMQLGCECTSLVYDNKTCYMFAKALITGNGNNVGYNKITECATAPQIVNAILQTYTGCNATYSCIFGYTSSASNDSNTITCQEDETWTPSDYACTQIPCPSPPPLTNGRPVVSSLQVGGVATYECDTNFAHSGGNAKTRTCVLGGTWSENINMACVPAVPYIIIFATHPAPDAITDANVYMIVFGQQGEFRIDVAATQGGLVPLLTVQDAYVGSLVQITIGHDNTGESPDWFLVSVVIATGGHEYMTLDPQWIRGSAVTVSLIQNVQQRAATLQTYTGCNATYGCNFGYTSSASSDSNIINCQADETWTPSDYECTQIPYPSPPPLTNGRPVVSSLLVGGVATYECDPSFPNVGGNAKTHTCVLGGTWSENIDMTCVPAVPYAIGFVTDPDRSTDANVYMIVFGQLGNFRIDIVAIPEGFGFFEFFQDTNGDVGSLERVTIGHDNTGVSPDWFLSSVTIGTGGRRYGRA